jgi:sugar O-acyltransferase (sialic acid O-acetyltransferase NeuD family)
MNHNIIIFGSGGMAQEVFELSFFNGEVSRIGNVVGYCSDQGVNVSFESSTGLSFIDLQTASSRFPNLMVLLCIGDPAGRRLVAEKIRIFGIKLLTFVHPSAVVAKSAQIGVGSVIYPFAVVSSNVRIGECCIVNSFSGVGHDVEMGDFCTLSAQVDLTGFVNLGEGVFIGSGARVLPKKKIGAYSKIGAGITVIRSLGAHSIVLPKPTEVLK